MTILVCEGLDGCGKSTQVKRLQQHLAAAGKQVRSLREPGGTALGERLREVLLDPATEADPVAELLAYQTARAQLASAVIRPAVAAGEVVLLDRFWYSTIAYQAYGLGMDESVVRQAIEVAVGDLQVDAALYFAVPPELARQRRAGTTNDRIEARDITYHQRVYDGYEAMANAGELIRINADQDIETIAEAAWHTVEQVLG